MLCKEDCHIEDCSETPKRRSRENLEFSFEMVGKARIEVQGQSNLHIEPHFTMGKVHGSLARAGKVRSQVSHRPDWLDGVKRREKEAIRGG